MNDGTTPVKERRHQLGVLANELDLLRKAMPRRDRVLIGITQALKVAIAASLGYYVALWVGLEQGFWAAITAISVTQSSYVEVRNSSRDQFIGAILGGVIGMAGAIIGHDHYPAYLLAVMAGTLLCWIGNLAAAGRISGITTTIIMLVPHAGSFQQVALTRLGEVILGAIAALLVTRVYDTVNKYLFPDPSVTPST